MNEILVVSSGDTTRRALCLQCEHHRQFDVPAAGGAHDDFVETLACKKRYISSCSMRAALLTPQAKCPRDDEWGLRWNAAALDNGQQCEPAVLRQESIVKGSLDREWLDTPRERRGMGRASFKVYQLDKSIGQ